MANVLRAEPLRLQAEYGLAAFVQLEGCACTLRGLQKTQGALARSIRAALRRYKDLQAQRAKQPTRVPLRQARREESRRLAPERQHLMNLIKMVAYQAESDLFAQIQPHYRRAAQEGRTLIQSALAGTADLQVTAEELRVRLHPLSSPHRTRAIAALCAELNTSPVCYPGSRLRLHFSVAEPPK